MRSSQSSLPESIQREVYAAIERARTPSDGSAIIATAEEQIAKSWDAEFAVAVAVAILNGNAASPRIVAKLSRQDTAQFAPSDTALILLALESSGVESRAKWRALAERGRVSNPDINAVALSALCHAMAAPRGDMGAPSPAALAHLRWIGKRLNLGYGNTPTGGDDDILTPETAFYTALAASHLPRSVFVADNPPLPYDWRNHLAARLVARQRFDPATRSYNWGDPRDSNFAILTLKLISN